MYHVQHCWPPSQKLSPTSLHMPFMPGKSPEPPMPCMKTTGICSGSKNSPPRECRSSSSRSTSLNSGAAKSWRWESAVALAAKRSERRSMLVAEGGGGRGRPALIGELQCTRSICTVLRAARSFDTFNIIDENIHVVKRERRRSMWRCWTKQGTNGREINVNLGLQHKEMKNARPRVHQPISACADARVQKY